MANSLTAFSPEYWSKRMQVVRIDEPVFKVLANYEERSELKDGDTVHRPYRSTMRVRTYSKGTAMTMGDVTATDESLSVGTSKYVGFYIDDLDELQNKYAVANAFADDAGMELWSFVDGEFLSEVVNATSDIDDGDIGGTAGNAAVVTASNVKQLFSAAAKKLDQQNISRKDRFAVVSPTIYQLLLEAMDGKDTALGDSTGKNGSIGKYMGFDLHMSNNLYWTGTWTPANNPTDGDTIVINGVTLTFKATPASAGHVDIGGSTAATLDNLVACINNSGTGDGSDYITLADASLKALEGCVAVDGTTYLGITFDGGSEVVVSASEAADPWSEETVHQMFGQKNAIDLVMQQEPKVVFKDVSDKLGKNIITWILYGMKTFTEGKAALVDVKVDSSAL